MTVVALIRELPVTVKNNNGCKTTKKKWKTMKKIDRMISKIIGDLWLWDMSRGIKKQYAEEDRQMKKRGYATVQELWQDEDYQAHLIANGNVLVINTDDAPEFDILDCEDHECTEDKHNCVAGRWEKEKNEQA